MQLPPAAVTPGTLNPDDGHQLTGLLTIHSPSQVKRESSDRSLRGEGEEEGERGRRGEEEEKEKKKEYKGGQTATVPEVLTRLF